MPAANPTEDRIRQVLKLLGEEARERLGRHPLGHLVAGRNEILDLQLSVPLASRDGGLEEATRQALSGLQSALESALAHWGTFRPGRIYCLRCRTPDCEHAAPADSREIFAGYGSTGLPRFVDFGQWLLERHHPKVDLLYETPHQLVTEIVPGRELARDVLPAYRDREASYRIHGQVVAGWYRVPDRLGDSRPLAVSFQLTSTRARRTLRLGLNVLGRGPDGEPLENLYDRMGDIPWADALRWGQSVLHQIEHSSIEEGEGWRRRLERRLEGLLQGLARRLERRERTRKRRTRHAEERRTLPDRPVSAALADLKRASSEEILFDTRRHTLIVLGERGRAHVFNQAGKLVTSVRYSTLSIQRRRATGLWRPATEGEIGALRQRMVEGRDEG